MIYEIQGRRILNISANRIINILLNELSIHPVKVQNVEDGEIEFKPYWGQFNWNLFAPISRGIFKIEKKGQQLILSYRLSLFRIRLITSVFTIIIILMPILSKKFDLLIFVMPISLISWICLYGLSFFITKIRLDFFLDRACNGGE